VPAMSFAGEELYADLPAALRRLLDTPPLTEKKLLELGVTWPGLAGAQARVAGLLRVFVITWDPLEHQASRPEGFATLNADHDGSELVVYLPIWSLVDSARTQRTTICAVIGTMAGSAVATAASIADTPSEAVTATRRPMGRGRTTDANDLLADRAGGTALGAPVIDLVSPGWEAIGLGAITDIVKHAFGPVDLDRSPVALAAAAQRQVGCPACAGRRFGFPADLAESQARMCPPHRVKADTVIRARLARANASNPDGYAAITDASSRIDRPHLPGGLATKLANAPQGMYVVPEPAELVDRARLVIEAAGWFPGRANDFAVALGEEPDLAGFLPDWLVNLVADLGRAGLGAEAVAVGDALATVDPGLRSMLDGDVGVALARAGLVDQTLAKIEDNVTRWPDDFWIRIHAGDALLALGDPGGAATHFHAAVDLAERDDDFEARSEAIERLQRLERLNRPERRGSKPEPGSRPTNQRNQKTGGGRSRRKRKR
jgi:hypothetical protein